MYNSSYTKDFSGKLEISRKYKLVFDIDGKVLCGINKDSICDLNGEEIAKLRKKNSIVNEMGKKVTQVIYDSSFGVFRLVDRVLFLDNVRVGGLSKKDKLSLAVLAVTGLTVALVIAVVALIDTPDNSMPRIVLGDSEGLITADREIGVFDSTIRPGSEGTFEYEIINPHGKAMSYTMDVDQYYNNEIIEDFPMRYKLKMNNQYLASLDNWVESNSLEFESLVIEPDSTTGFTLEWSWPFESGNDEYDTFNEHCCECKLPGVAHGVADSEYKECIESHTGSKTERKFGPKSHDERTDDSSQGGSGKGSSGRHTVEHTEHGWIDRQDVRHGEESRNTRKDFRADGRFFGIEPEQFG